MDATPNLLLDLPKLLCLAIALVGGLFAATTWWRRHHASAGASLQRNANANLGKIIYQDAPTVRVVDSQRVDRIRKIVRLTPNESIDILENRGSPIPRFRLTLKEIMHGDAPAVRLMVEYGGTPLSCGPLVKELGRNEFVLPRVAREEPRSAILHFHERGDALDFMRIKLRSVDAQTSVAEIDVMQVSGNWPCERSG
jgi:hypothetical protein